MNQFQKVIAEQQRKINIKKKKMTATTTMKTLHETAEVHFHNPFKTVNNGGITWVCEKVFL